MCGIFGVVGWKPDTATVNDALALLRHRGPDDSGYVYLDNGVLASTRLSIVDLSPAGHQPMSDASGRCWLVYNGEIYNYRSLRTQLGAYPFRSETDSEVILAGYLRWGEQVVERLRGMFAFALWDSLEGELLCAVDRFTIKPLYYAIRDGHLIVSSEIKPILRCGVAAEVDERTLYEYLAYGLLNHGQRTFFRNIFQFRPAQYLVYRGGEMRLGTYWDVPVDSDRLSGWKPADVEESVREALEEAVRLHLVGDVEIGISLSSGLDSNLLRFLAQRDRGPLRCFTYCFPGTPYDEGALLKVQWGIDGHGHHRRDVTPDDVTTRLPHMVRAAEQPPGGVGILGYSLSCQQASEHGLKVLLAGQGSDEAFGGYRYYYQLWLGDLARSGQTNRLRAELEAFNGVHGTTLRYPSADFDRLARRETSDSLMLASDGSAMAGGSYLARDFAEAYRTHCPDLALRQPFENAAQNAMYHDLLWLKLPKLLRFFDASSMSSSVEVRVPYLDHVLVETLFAIPPEMLFSGGLTKSLLRTVGTQLMGEPPPQVPKLYAPTPQREWLKGPLREYVFDHIEHSRLGAAGIIDTAALRRQYSSYCRDSDLANSFFAWQFLELEHLYRAFFAAPALSGVYA